ncbi:MAG: hypothetical protein HY810_01315 [Candidatus Omnitrophica bacterium]|nr:hypothetical protein [Candidatus Omnitrophota bacterium]
MIKKILIGIFVFIAALVFILAVGKNIIIKKTVTSGVKVVTGLDMKIDKINVGVMNSLLNIEGLKLFNPEGFEDKLMVDLPEIFVDYDLEAFFKEKAVHLQEVRLNLNEFTVIKNKEGVLNLDSLKPVQSAKKEQEEPNLAEEEPKQKQDMPKIKIDKLKLKIGKVITKDYSAKGEPVINEFNINIDETFENITDPNEIVKIILKKVLPKLSAQFLKNAVSGGVESMLKESKELVGDAAEDVLGLGKDAGGKTLGMTKEAAKNLNKSLKNLLPIGKR